MREDPFISQAMVYGDRRPYPVALVALDREQLLQFARTHDLPSSDYTQLTRHPKVLERIVADKNARLPSYARIKKFAVLPADVSEETGELTPSQKLKRKVVAEKYAGLLKELYGSQVATPS